MSINFAEDRNDREAIVNPGLMRGDVVELDPEEIYNNQVKGFRQQQKQNSFPFGDGEKQEAVVEEVIMPHQTVSEKGFELFAQEVGKDYCLNTAEFCRAIFYIEDFSYVDDLDKYISFPLIKEYSSVITLKKTRHEQLPNNNESLSTENNKNSPEQVYEDIEQSFVSKDLPERQGDCWTEREDQKLNNYVKECEKNNKVPDFAFLANKHKRTIGAVKDRIDKLYGS